MKHLVKALLILVPWLLATSPLQAQGAREWTVMVWIAGDDNKNTSLEESQVRNMDELSELGSGPGYDIAVQVDRGNKVSGYLRSRYSDPDYADLGRIADSVLTGNTGLGRASNFRACAEAAQKLKDALRASRASMWYSGPYAEQKVSGLSILWPDKETYAKYRAFYKSTDFAKASTWDEFLDWRELGAK